MELDFPYSSWRTPVFGDAIVATTQPLAAQAGIAALAQGGNAVDAAVAAAITLTVVEPTMNGVGGDLFAIVHAEGAIHGLNASGPAPSGLEAARLRQQAEMPMKGWDTVTVPGAVAGWRTLHRRFGALPFADLFTHAIRLARDGFPVPFAISRQWELQAGWFGGMPGFDETFLPGGRAPAAGERFHHAHLAMALDDIARTDGESFYRGRLAAQIERFARETSGTLRATDLAAYAPEWVDPVTLAYGGRRVHELPPNGQGVGALIALGIMAHLPIAKRPLDDPLALHLAIEATRLALSDVHVHVADPRDMTVPVAELLDPERHKALASRIDPNRTSGLAPKPARTQGTVYVAAADSSGMMASLIQSNYRGFGSGLVVPGTGIALHNRGACFNTDPASPNVVAPGKRPLNTIIPGFLTDVDGAPRAAFGVMGGSIQAQAHVQVVHRLLDHGLHPQATLDAPRWRVADDGGLQVEATMASSLREALSARGHQLRMIPSWSHEAGAGQIILRQRDSYIAGSDARRDGAALAR